MGEDKSAGAGSGRQGAGLPGGEVAIMRREPGVVVAEGGLRDEEVDAVGQLLSAGARFSVHDEGKTLPGPRNAYILQTHTTQAAFAQ